MTNVLKFLAVAAFVTLMFGIRAALYPIVEYGGLPITILIIASCLGIAHWIEWRRANS